MHPKQQHIIDVYGKPITTLDELAESCIAVVNENIPVVGFAWDVQYSPTVGCSHNAPLGHRDCFAVKKEDPRPRHFPGLQGRFWIRYANSANHKYDWCGNMTATLTHTGSGGSGAYNGPWTDINNAAYSSRNKVADTGRAWGVRHVYKYPEPRCYSTDYKIFLQDFPDLELNLDAEYAAHEAEEDKLQTFAKVANKYHSRRKFVFTHLFTWEDPVVKAADQAFLKEYNDSLAVSV